MKSNKIIKKSQNLNPICQFKSQKLEVLPIFNKVLDLQDGTKNVYCFKVDGYETHQRNSQRIFLTWHILYTVILKPKTVFLLFQISNLQPFSPTL